MTSIEVGGLIVNSLMMLIAIASSFISYLIYRENTRPDVIVYIEQDKDARTMLNLVIKNIGKNSARDVTFSCDKALPQSAFRGNESFKMSQGALITGIPFLAPGATRVIMFGQYEPLQKWFTDEKIRIDIKFYKANSIFPCSRAIKNVSYLEIFSFSNVSASDNTTGKKIVQELQKINKSIFSLKQ